MKRRTVLILGLSLFLGTCLAVAAWAAYSAHQNDADINHFLTVYPTAKSTKLDDCALCHKSGKIGSKPYGSCDYCHQVYKTAEPHGNILETLNSYGSAYHEACKTQDPVQAIQAIANIDSDGDGYLNGAEIQALTFPGNASDLPGLVPAPAIGMNMERLLNLPGYSEFLLLNTSKEATDFYARYRGVKMIDLLKFAGIGKNATQITVFSPDGFSQVFPIDVPDPQTDPTKIQYDVMGPYPYGTFYGGLDFVEYPYTPGCFKDGDRIPDKLYMLLAYLRNGDPLTPGRINPISLKLDGEGPYRLIPPQKIAGGPDRSKNGPYLNDGWDYQGNKDHNAGFSARTVAAIRVDPLPPGTTDVNWFEGGWNLVDGAKLVIYGAINPHTYRVTGKVLDETGKGTSDVKLAFSLLSLGQVGETTTSTAGGSGRKKVEGGKFQIDLPTGEYTLIPYKEGCTFVPASLSISLPYPECDMNHDEWNAWDHWDRFDYCNRYPENEMKIIASCPSN